MGTAARRAAALAALLTCSACGLFHGKDLGIAEVFARPDAHRVPVIVVPGVVGSILGDRKTGEVGWVRAAEAFLLSSSTDLALPDDPKGTDRLTSLGILETVEVLPGLLAFQQFEPVLGALKQAGYTIGSAEFPRPEEDAFVFHFDFRRDGVDSVKQLARAIDRVRSTRKDPNERVALLTQSYGGLIARYFLMYGDRDVLDEEAPKPDGRGAEDVSHVVFFGTAHTGALVLFEILRSGYVVGLNGTVLSPEVMASFPAAYQVLPRPSENVFVNGKLEPYLGADGKPLSLYDESTWLTLGWIRDDQRNTSHLDRVARYLDRGRRWWHALEQPWAPPPRVAFLSCVGASQPTPRRAVIDRSDEGDLVISFEAPSSAPDAERANRVGPVLVPGDGRVTLESALAFPYGIRLVSDQPHDLIHQDSTVLKNVLMFLLYSSPPALRVPTAPTASPEKPETDSRPAPAR